MDPFQHFLDAQAPVYETALAELRAGRKRTHWIWFIFPQLAGPGLCPLAQMRSSPSFVSQIGQADAMTLGQPGDVPVYTLVVAILLIPFLRYSLKDKTASGPAESRSHICSNASVWGWGTESNRPPRTPWNMDSPFDDAANKVIDDRSFIAWTGPRICSAVRPS